MNMLKSIKTIKKNTSKLFNGIVSKKLGLDNSY